MIGSYVFGFNKPASAVFDPATLSLSGWWRTDYSGSPWTANSSAGNSGSNGSLTEGTNPPSNGAAINGHTPPDFDGTNDKLGNSNGIGTFISSTAWSLSVLFNMDTAGASGPGADYGEAQFATDDVDAFFYFSFSTRGVTCGHYDGSSFKEVNVACATGGWHLAQGWFDGTNLNLAIDSGGASQTAAGNASISSTGKLRVGANYLATAFIDGRVAELMISNTDLGGTARSNIKSYCNSRYALSL